MKEFLSDPWFEELNSRLSRITLAPLPEGARACRVTFDLPDGPAHLPGSLTLDISKDAVHVAPGDLGSADAFVRLSYDDAAGLSSGRLESAAALREGRIKVRGDVNVLVPLAGCLHSVLAG